MIKKILGSIGSKFISGILNFVLTILITQFLGAGGKGEIGIFVLNLTVILMLSDLVGGAGLVYLIPRTDVFKTLALSYGWAVFSSILVVSAFYFIDFVRADYLLHLFLLSLLMNFTSVNSNILVGKEMIRQSNILLIGQIFIQVIFFVLLIYVYNETSIYSFFYSLYLSQGITLLAGILTIRKIIPSFQWTGWITDFINIIRYGLYIQTGNFLQLMNYRFSYYLLEHYHGLAPVGVFSTGSSLCEAAWIISNGIARVQYASISNNTDLNYAKELTVQLSRVCFIATLIALLPLLFLPPAFYEWIFGDGFGEINVVIISLFTGTLLLGFTAMFSHYFAGTGKAKINTLASFLGFLVTVVAGLFLIPRYGLTGAGITSSLSYSLISVFLVVIFMKSASVSALQLIPGFNDLRHFISYIKSLK